jgi:ubiquinone/menaquinone biosynthesis C-methylase UbiE
MPDAPVLKSFDRVAHIYDETRRLPEHIESALAQSIAGVARSISPSPALFECGIGTGRLAVPLAMQGVRIAGCDISPKMVAILRQKRRDIDVVMAEAARLPFRDATFDCAAFFHILHLVPDREASIRATAALVRPGGALMLCIDRHAPGSLGEHVDQAMERITREEVGHFKGGAEVGAEIDADFVRVLGGLGARIERRPAGTYGEPSSVRRIVDGMRNRQGSGSWMFTQQQIDALARRQETEVSALTGGIDAPFEFDHEVEVVVAWLPAGG